MLTHHPLPGRLPPSNSASWPSSSEQLHLVYGCVLLFFHIVTFILILFVRVATGSWNTEGAGLVSEETWRCQLHQVYGQHGTWEVSTSPESRIVSHVGGKQTWSTSGWVGHQHHKPWWVCEGGVWGEESDMREVCEKRRWCEECGLRVRRGKWCKGGVREEEVMWGWVCEEREMM